MLQPGTQVGNVAGLGLRAWAVVSAAGALLRGQGVSGVVRTGTGQYTVTFAQALTDSAGVVDARPTAGQNAGATADALGGLSTASVVVQTRVTGAATDHPFYVAVYQ